jgi:nitroreductase
MTQTNQTIDLLNARCSTRAYSSSPIGDDEKQVILHAAMRAPTAGNMMLYSIVEIEDQALKDRLAVTCDDQPFIARAPWVLLFVADLQKWMDLFSFAEVDRMAGLPQDVTPELADLMLACADALIAAENAVVAAESLGIGSCYVGDVVEHGEIHAELLSLPQYTFPAALLCFGRPASRPHVTAHYEKHMVHKNAYQRLSQGELRDVSDDLDRHYGARRSRAGVGEENAVQYVYRRKFTADFAAEANRSVAWWIERWTERT